MELKFETTRDSSLPMLNSQIASGDEHVLAGSTPNLANSEDLRRQVAMAMESIHEATSAAKPQETADAIIFAQAAPATVLVVTEHGFGFGSVVSDDGKVLTDADVVLKPGQVAVLFPPGTERGIKRTALRATVLKIDQTADLALLAIQSSPQGLKHLHVGNIGSVRVDGKMHVFGAQDGRQWEFTPGTIIRVLQDQRWKGIDGFLHHGPIMEVDFRANRPSPGAAMLNDRGEIVAVTSLAQEGNRSARVIGALVTPQFVTTAP